METILQILPWIGTALGTVFGWILNRKVNQAKSKKEVHDTFMKMYEDVSASLLTLQKKYDELNAQFHELQEKDVRTIRALNRLSKAIEAIPLCDYHSQCPVLGELRLIEDGGAGPGETPGVNGRTGGGERGADQPGGSRRKGKSRADASGHRHQHPARRGGVQPAGGKHPRVGQEAEGRLGGDPCDKPEDAGTGD